MKTDYDIIIIGSGAGGGTLARHLAPSGKSILHPGTRRLAQARTGELERRGGLREEPLRLARTSGTTRTASSFSPARIITSAARRRCTARRSSACARRISAGYAHYDGISPGWPISYDDFEPYYTQAEQLYQVHGARGEDPTEPPASAPYPLPAGLARAAHPEAFRRSRQARAIIRSTRRAASCSTRRTCPTAPACAARTATAFPASSTPSRTRK